MTTINGKLVHSDSVNQQKLTQQISEQVIQLEQTSQKNVKASQHEILLLNTIDKKINNFDNQYQQQITAFEKILNRKIFPLLTSTILFTTLISFLIFHFQKDSICEYQSYSSNQVQVD